MQGNAQAVPLNFGFVHLQNEQGDDIMRYMWAAWVDTCAKTNIDKLTMLNEKEERHLKS